MLEAPWTGLGAVQHDLITLKSELNRKANDYDVHEARRLVDSLERTVRSVSTEVDGLRFRIEQLEARELERQQMEQADD